ncbi:hypothetical protein ATANTOWER_012841 [Ataeniobius toweri]|uniref:Uncharacterized protein n=1 Tax=Ataeniobius toweri TaxID=208326 RepID=A0ABU7BJN5_9TELE|nr:hypothetical protein [Ataeniobius toweri]
MEDGSFCPPTNCTVTVTTVMRSLLSSFQTGKTAPLGFVETVSLQGILWSTVCFCRPRCVPGQPRTESGWKRSDHWKGGGFIQAVASWEVRCYPPSPSEVVLEVG